MGWRLRIEHTTSVGYAGPVLTSFNEARMTPLTLPSQLTHEARVTAGPGVPVWTYNDYWGTYVSVFDLPEPHDDLVIRAIATVETEPFGGVGATGQRPSWAELGAAAANSRLLEFLLPTPLTAVAEPLSAAAPRRDRRPVTGRGRRGGLRACARARRLPARRDRRAHQRAVRAWDKGKGVLLVTRPRSRSLLLRAAGLPARLRLRSYLHPDPECQSQAAPPSASPTPGWSTGRAPADAPRPHQPRPLARTASATWSSRAAATTLRRPAALAASTTARAGGDMTHWTVGLTRLRLLDDQGRLLLGRDR